MKVTPSKFKPFQLVRTDATENVAEKVIIVAGNTQASPLDFATEEEAEDYLLNQPYEMFTNLYTLFRYYENKDKKQNQESMEKDA